MQRERERGKDREYCTLKVPIHINYNPNIRLFQLVLVYCPGTYLLFLNIKLF